MGKLILYGASGHAKVIIDILIQNGEQEFVLMDDDVNIDVLNGYKVHHPNDFETDLNDKFLVSIGINRTRKDVSQKITHKFFSAVHPHAQINTNVDLGDGTMIAAGVVINSETSVGMHCIINTKSSIDHDCDIVNFVHIAPGVTICGGVSIGEGTLVGAGATILPNLKIGNWATIGAGAVVTVDVPDDTTVVGVPAKQLN